MSQILGHLAPKNIWTHFERLCAIPRPSKHEEQVARYLVDFAKGLGLETVVDQVGNVIIRKPATPGMEDRRVVCLQAHMDMVPQKNSDVVHDFLKDPIRPRIEGNHVRATGTTLGADNGIGVAAIMAVFEAKDLKHGPLEALITVNEEAGMTGAKGLKPGFLKADFMLNLDSEDEKELCVGCAGGLDTTITFTLAPEAVSSDYQAFEVRVGGLRGGHSGMDIGLGRGNANILMARLLVEAGADVEARLVQFNGGDLRNVITREAAAVVLVRADQADRFRNRIESEGVAICNEFSVADPDISVVVKQTETMPAQAFSMKDTRRVIEAIHAAPNGPMYMTAGMPDLVETSTNIGAVKTEGNIIRITTLQRSSVDTRKVELAHRVAAVYRLAGAQAEHHGGYTGWKPNMKSPLLKLLKDVYVATFGHDAEVKATHGGLECGIIMGAYPSLDAISFGPTLHFPHSPDEHIEIDSVGRFWKFLVKVLEGIPAR